MPRQLDTRRTRLVLTGSVTGPETLAVEYSIVAGDLTQRGMRAEMDEPSFSSPSADLWTSAISTVETAEGIS